MQWNHVFFAAYLATHPELLRVAARGVYLPAYINFGFLREFSPLPDTVIDVGANDGRVARAFLELLPEAEVHAFEPMAEPFAQLARVGGGRLFNNRVAVTDRVGTATFHALPDYSPASSLYPVTEGFRSYPGLGGAARQDTVETTTLDAYFAARPLRGRAVLKLDTQGSELLALQGAERTLESVDVIHCETGFVEVYEGQCLFPGVYDFLTSRGFIYAGAVNESWFYPQFSMIPFENSLFVRPDRLPYRT